MTRRRALALALVAALALALVGAEVALAQGGGGPNVGERLGGWLQEQAVWLWAGVGAIVALIFLVSRRFGELVGWLAVWVVVGVIVVAPEAAKGFIETTAEMLFS